MERCRATPRLQWVWARRQTINETARCKIIGLTLETRPDTIDAAELQRLRYYGCTRVQLSFLGWVSAKSWQSLGAAPGR